MRYRVSLTREYEYEVEADNEDEAEVLAHALASLDQEADVNYAFTTLAVDQLDQLEEATA